MAAVRATGSGYQHLKRSCHAIQRNIGPLAYLTAPDTAPKDLLTRLATQQAQIGILGLGYVGLPLMLRFAEVGYPVLGFDIDPAKVEQLNAGQS